MEFPDFGGMWFDFWAAVGASIEMLMLWVVDVGLRLMGTLTLLKIIATDTAIVAANLNPRAWFAGRVTKG